MMVELLTSVMIDEEKYAAYSVDNKDGTHDLLVAHIYQDGEGCDWVEDIIDEEMRVRVFELVPEPLKQKRWNLSVDFFCHLNNAVQKSIEQKGWR